VASLSLEFANNIKQPNNLINFYSEDALLSFNSDLPFGGTYEFEDIDLFFHRFENAFNVESAQHQLLSSDEANGVAILQTTFSGIWKRKGTPATLILIHVLEWDTLDNKITTHLVLNQNIAETMELYSTAAEKNLASLYWSMFRSNVNDLNQGVGPVWDKISDSIQVKINMYPSDITPKTVWTGKQQVLQAMKEFHSKDLVLLKDFAENIKNLKFKVLFSNDHEVWVKMEFAQDNSHPVVLVHYIFDGNGLLVSEEVTLGAPLKPWEVYPFPFAVNKMDKQFAPSSTLNIDHVEKLMQVGSIGTIHKAHGHSGTTASRPMQQYTLHGFTRGLDHWFGY
jgi:hypothetical protein